VYPLDQRDQRHFGERLAAMIDEMAADAEADGDAERAAELRVIGESARHWQEPQPDAT
jgi:hypothetical protein